MASFGDISSNIQLIDNQSIRRNEGNTQFEAFVALPTTGGIITGDLTINSSLFVNSNVGINTIAPMYNLDVSGDVGIYGNLFIDGSSSKISITDPLTPSSSIKMGFTQSAGVSYPCIWINQDVPSASNYTFRENIFNSPTTGFYFRVGNVSYASLNNNGFSINTGNTLPSAGNGLIIGTGKVGINTRTPTSTLDVSGNFKVGSTQGNVTIDTSGNLVLNENATTFNDFLVPLVTSKQGQIDKPIFNYNEVAYMFPQNDPTEILYFTIQMPHSWKMGSLLYPHVHYKQAIQTQLPVFKLDYKMFNIGESMPSTWKTVVMDTSVVAWVDSSTHQMNDGAAIDASSYRISALLLCKLYRDDNVITGPVTTWQFDIHYEIDGFGSNFEYIK
jgi:hypothetical protein